MLLMEVEFLECREENNFLSSPTGGRDFMESFIDDKQLRGLSFKVPNLSGHGRSPILSSAGPELRSLLRISDPY